MPNPLVEGEWSAAMQTPGDSVTAGDGKGVFVVHAVLLHTGKVMWWSGHAEWVHYIRQVIVWDPLVLDGAGKPDTSPGKVEIHTPPTVGGREIDPFCCFHVQVADGRILTMGGAGPGPPHATGLRDICIFDPTRAPGPTRTDAWTRIGAMAEGRWYPTAVHLGDDRVFVLSGHSHRDQQEDPVVVNRYIIPFRVEVLSPVTYAASTVTVTEVPAGGGPRAFPTYPSLHLVSGDRIVHTGTNWRVSYPALPGIQLAQPVMHMRMTGPTALRAEAFGLPINNREEGTAVLLSPAQDGKILLLGGGRIAAGAHNALWRNPPLPPEQPVVSHKADFALTGNPKSARIVSGNASPVGSRAIADMHHARINANAVLLVDGKVLVLGGHDYYKWSPEQVPSMACELFDPVAETWTLAAVLHERRTYHSAALLLPDGSVIVAGGVNPTTPEPAPTGPQMHGHPNTALNQKTFEIYKPPYLFIAGTRPTITAVRDEYDLENRVTYGRRFTVETPQAAEFDVRHGTVVLMRPGAMTHHTDTEQRRIPLAIQGRTGNRVELTMLPDPSVAPPGFYMLFIIGEGGRVCERAKFVHVAGTGVHGPPPPPPPPPPAPPVNRDSGICFSVVAFGSDLHPDVAFLRSIRDVELGGSRLGRCFAALLNRIYYSFSPALARYLTGHPRARAAVRNGALLPLVRSLRVVLSLHRLSRTAVS